jgi:hypothetical protein
MVRMISRLREYGKQRYNHRSSCAVGTPRSKDRVASASPGLTDSVNGAASFKGINSHENNPGLS